MKVVSLSVLRTGRPYAPWSIPGTHFCKRLCRPQGHSAVRRIISITNTNDTTWNQTRDLLANPIRTFALFPRASSLSSLQYCIPYPAFVFSVLRLRQLPTTAIAKFIAVVHMDNVNSCPVGTDVMSSTLFEITTVCVLSLGPPFTHCYYTSQWSVSSSHERQN
jgi:hypothetical protein